MYKKKRDGRKNYWTGNAKSTTDNSFYLLEDLKDIEKLEIAEDPKPFAAVSPLELVWIDLEMTGLDLTKDTILEVACILTDAKLDRTVQGPDMCIFHDESVLQNMNKWSQEQHSKSGLVDRVRESNITITEAEESLIKFLKAHNLGAQDPELQNTVVQDVSTHNIQERSRGSNTGGEIKRLGTQSREGNRDPSSLSENVKIFNRPSEGKGCSNQQEHRISNNAYPRRGIIAGNSVHVDLSFLQKYMPRFTALLDPKKILDVTSVTELIKRWNYSAIRNSNAKRCEHTAMSDVKESIEQLRYLRRVAFN
mmetsp:Transcript_33626/g.60715  ORF Transcript_33626/g.60715 Transcript_33626/m.60715 type:complete len:308 (-) Transcript_33626:886-1809(-)|eukprot:CAMPEP_0175078884 /NCGR_PEP_ID=MMETSP0052_2-20121109/24450_1 /TAXON_ID=51329 ORGANISM="Polytomella parva, Strain SAG 63-3" /NCGR_SAMPLE_ID=MMETSP0052_2 /ASSEMBLY_ACC=CAM_ASM_000194 /LENGTH=307 /DNA_ID=CAMNT_0016349023 /DNA_START=89 /DNA_END=1012 /DNA_ORIENTATION=-